jgi:hypothetical protein
MSNSVFVAGVGMIPFKKPGDSLPYNEMGAEAIRLALADAGDRLLRRAAGVCRLRLW